MPRETRAERRSNGGRSQEDTQGNRPNSDVRSRSRLCVVEYIMAEDRKKKLAKETPMRRRIREQGSTEKRVEKKLKDQKIYPPKKK